MLQSAIVGQALISVSGQGVMSYLGLLGPPLASGKGARWNMKPRGGILYLKYFY